MATDDIAKAIGGDGEVLWNSISKYVSVVDTIGDVFDKDDSTFDINDGGTSTTITTTGVGEVKDKVVDAAGEAIGISTPSSDSNTGQKSVPEDDPNCKSKGVTNKGIIRSARWKAIINGAMLALNTANSLKMAKLQRDIGKAYQELAEDQRKYYNDRYKPLEVSLTQEALNLKKYDRDKEKLITGQMLISARNLTAGKIDKALACTGRYCTGQRAAIMNDQLLEQAAIESLAAGLAHRYVDKDEITHNNLRWEKREQVLKIGRDIPTQAVSYASMAAGIFGSLGKQAGQAAEGAMGFLAYGRGETVYPERRPPLTYPAYIVKPTTLELFKPEPPKIYEKPKPQETVISLRG